MDIKLVYMYFEDTPVPFMEWEGEKYTTGSVLATTLGVPSNAIHSARAKQADMFQRSLTLSSGQGKGLYEFLAVNKGALNLQRMRKDTVLYELRDSIRLAFYVRSKKAADFSDAVVEFYAQNMKSAYVSQEEYQKVVDQLTTLTERMDHLQPLLQSLASNAGKDLAAAKLTKPFRIN